MITLNYPSFWQRKSWINYLLLPLSGMYWVLGCIRKILYIPVRFPAKVICVGNISVGGTGKTQVVKLLAEYCTAKDLSFVILVRSYRGQLDRAMIVNSAMDAKIVGDEAIELSEYGTVIATKHYTDGMEIIEKIAPQIILIDDGMQNPRFLKDITLLTIDGMRRLGNEMLMPAGPLRQSVSSAAYEAVVVIGNKNYSFKSSKKFFYADIVVKERVPLPQKSRYFAFAAIGNPEKFFHTLTEFGYDIAKTKTFPDHHNYSEEEIQDLVFYASKHGLQLITTKKDIGKLRTFAGQIIALDVTLMIENSFYQFLEARL